MLQVPLFVFYSHSDLGGFIESVDPVNEILLVICLQEELPHPGIDDYMIIKKKKEKKKSRNSQRGKCVLIHLIY